MASRYTKPFTGVDYDTSSEEEFDEFDISTDSLSSPMPTLPVQEVAEVPVCLVSPTVSQHSDPLPCSSTSGNELLLSGMTAMNDLLENSLSQRTLTEYKVCFKFKQNPNLDYLCTFPPQIRAYVYLSGL